MFHQNLSQHNLNEVYLGRRIKKTMDLSQEDVSLFYPICLRGGSPGNKRGLDNKSGRQTENGLERGFDTSYSYNRPIITLYYGSIQNS